MNAKDLLVPTQRQMLGTLKGLLAKAAADPRGDALLSARLAEDMHPLSVQVRFLCNMVGEAMARIAGIEFTSSEDDPATIAAAQARVDETLMQLAEWENFKFVADDAAIELAIPNGMTFDMTAAEYVRDWSVPQFYFHTMAAYSILRKEGIEVGKADFVPYMMRYIRAPAS
ncbi:DUF1993 domain-containing protein [Erythrobacter sp. YT30]|uniref:DUF1993 family protein n=1 Tax=Erythrobacter sp. YT30 TaxID=1735012 RepID=UPI00076D65C5|nr:DUF1993 domain-containing protein [Erythrobacter sp. YT30]KWV91390.1 hypothetical protein AUC45_08975 [Erythrobacter sp. YT30]